MRQVRTCTACLPLLLLVLGLLTHPVQAGKVRTAAAPGVNLAQYKTYQWLPTRALMNTGLVENDPVLTPLIKEAVNRELTQLGLKEIAEGGDLQVATGVTTHAVAQMEAVLFAGPQDLDFATPIATMGRYNRKGSLIVNLIDSKTKKSAWAGIAEENLDDIKGSGLKKISKAAEKLFKKYPQAQ
jgi:Domain of unknown function (DUF4136)